MGWFTWVVLIGGIWLIQETRGEVSAGIFGLGMLGWFGYCKIMKRLSNIEFEITGRAARDVEIE